MSLEEWAYWGGLVQGEGLREYCDNFRRRMFSSASAIFWMFNDCWPTVRSWTIVDYYLRKTPAFHPVRRALASYSVVVAEENDQVVIYGVNDTPAPLTATLRFGVMNLAGSYPVDETTEVTLAPNASTRLASFDKSKWKNPTKSAAFAMLTKGEKLIARNRLFLPLFKEIQWPKAKLNVQVKDGKAIFTSNAFVWGVCLDLDGEKKLADNFFDVWPGIPYSIPWRGSEKPQVRIGNL
jgi:beta-mannosidase